MSATNAGAWAKPPPGNGAAQTSIVDALSLDSWLNRHLPPRVRLLGDVITNNSRVWLVGTTGIGKTLLAHAIAGAVAAGADFCHWQCEQATRVLIIDGEMSVDGLQSRLRLMQQHQPGIDPHMLLCFSLQDQDAIAAQFPHLLRPQALNSPEGIDWIIELIKLCSPGLVVFDNVMSLLAGSMKEEDTWEPAKPLVQYLTKLGIAQMWLDHTGWNANRQYGTSTKGWMFDVVAVQQALDDEAKAALGHGETGFTVGFDPPAGKARNRHPDRWEDFAPVKLVLLPKGMGWSHELLDPKADAVAKAKAKAAPKPYAQRFHKSLLDALVSRPMRPGETTRAAWQEECIRVGLVPESYAGETGIEASKRLQRFRTALADLVAAQWISCDGSLVKDLRQSYS